MLHKKIKELVEILKAEDIDEIELRHWWTTVRVVRRRPVKIASIPETAALNATGGPSAAAGIAGEAPGERTGEMPAAGGDASVGEAAGGDGAFEQILSPMVGTFYRAPAPDSDPFVSVGDRVEVGEVLCIIEAMKLMNEIEADRCGVIRKVLAEDSQPVEFGQPLFLVESA